MSRYFRYLMMEYKMLFLQMNTRIWKFIFRNPGPTAITLFIAAVVSFSDLNFGGKIFTFVLMTTFAFIASTDRVRSTYDTVDCAEPNEPIVEHDIGKTAGDRPDLDSPTMFRKTTRVVVRHTVKPVTTVPTDGVFSLEAYRIARVRKHNSELPN